MCYGFSAVLVVFSSVVLKLTLSIYSFNQSSVYFKRNIDILNFYNFSLVDLSVAVLIFSMLIVVIYGNKRKKVEA